MGVVIRVTCTIMTGSCSLWLPLLALLPLIRIAPVYCQHTEDYGLTFLLAIKNNESGLEVRTLFPENHGSVSNNHASQRPDYELEFQVQFIPGHSLSSECGGQYLRCQELLVETSFLRGDGGVLNIVFIPLEKGILLLSWYDSNIILTSTMEFNSSSSNCSTIVFYKISGNFYMVCISSYEYFAVYVYEIQLKLRGSVVEDMILIGPLLISLFLIHLHLQAYLISFLWSTRSTLPLVIPLLAWMSLTWHQCNNKNCPNALKFTNLYPLLMLEMMSYC